MASQVTNYQCPACTAPLAYDGASGQLACEYCGSSFPVSEIEALYADQARGAVPCWRGSVGTAFWWWQSP